MPRVALDWRLSDIDIRSVSVLVDALGHELKRLGLGTVEKAKWMDEGQWKADPLISSHPIGGYHHMGTTRMGSNARTSVTDSDGRVHGIARSEEHTSELQLLMRISYAAFCLKKKKT